MRVIHYLNQFFGGLGGEDKADAPLSLREGAVGPGRLLQKLLGSEVEIVATLICGDNTAQYQATYIKDEAIRLAQEHGADLLFAGPSFESGRYGLACAEVAEAAHRAGLSAVVAMHPDNPGVRLCPADVPVVKAGESAMEMAETIKRVRPVLLRRARGESLTEADRQRCVSRDIRCNVTDTSTGASRAISMLLAKIGGAQYRSEVLPPRFAAIVPAAPVDPATAKIALLSTGGLVPRGNPDRLEASSATKWLRYSLDGRPALSAEEFECIHAGIDTSAVNNDPNRLVPLDACTDLESKGFIGSLASELFVTVGNLTPVAKAEQFAVEIAQALKEINVTGVILTST